MPRQSECPAGPQPAALSESQGLPEAVPPGCRSAWLRPLRKGLTHQSLRVYVPGTHLRAAAAAPQKPAGRGRAGAVAGRPGLLKIHLLQVKRHFENALPTTPLQQGILGYSALAQIHSHLLAMYRSRCLIYRRIKIKSDDVMS